MRSFSAARNCSPVIPSLRQTNMQLSPAIVPRTSSMLKASSAFETESACPPNVFTTTILKAAQDGEPLDSSCAETYSDLLDSFMVKLEDEDVTKEVLSYCKKIWKECLTNDGVYNYLGEKL